MAEPHNVEMEDQLSAHTYHMVIKSLHYSDWEEVDQNGGAQYHKNEAGNYELEDSCNISNEDSEPVKISWPEQTTVNSQEPTASTSTPTTAAPITNPADDEGDDDEPSAITQMPTNIARGKKSRRNAWLRVNGYREEDRRRQH